MMTEVRASEVLPGDALVGLGEVLSKKKIETREGLVDRVSMYGEAWKLVIDEDCPLWRVEVA